MSRYTANALVTIRPFIRQSDGQDVVIGQPDAGTFLVLPPDALELLDWLAAGRTVGEVRGHYAARHGAVLDLEDFLQRLEEEGFVSLTADLSPAAGDAAMPAQRSAPRYHFSNFPQPLAQALFGPTMLVVYGTVVASALFAIAVEPSLIPGWRALFFTEDITLNRLLLIVASGAAVFLHEMAHLVAARAVGVSCRLSLGNRLWMLVAETDMTGIWAVPRRQRYLPFLAGPLLDTVSAAVIILVFFGAGRGLVELPCQVAVLGRALLLHYLLGLLWQCYFFVQTDFYYVFATLFGCKSLMRDTTIFMKNKLARLVPWIRHEDQSYVPAREMTVIRWYSLVWLGGRVAALGTLAFISLPLTASYVGLASSSLQRGRTGGPPLFDVLGMGVLTLTPQLLGMWLWFRQLLDSRR